MNYNKFGNGERKYDDIINMPHPVSKKHPPMSPLDRAAQFSPFAALTGHNEAIKETARITDERIELDEDSKEILNKKLQALKKQLEDRTEKQQITVTYFEPDARKSGGSYVTVTGVVKRLKGSERKIVFDSGNEVLFDDIIEILS